MILHIPHSSTIIPADLREQFLFSDQEIQEELIRMTDHFTHELFDWPNCSKAIFPISRLLVDAERFEHDEREEMAARGMGVIYERSSVCTPMKRKCFEYNRSMQSWRIS